MKTLIDSLFMTIFSGIAALGLWWAFDFSTTQAYGVGLALNAFLHGVGVATNRED